MNNILITSAGRRVSLVRMFKKELNHFFPTAKLYTTDYQSDGSFKVVKNDADGYIKELLDLAIKYDIKIIIPTIDTGLQILANQRDLFLQFGIHLIISSSNLIEVCRDKRKTSAFFTHKSIDTPRIFEKDQLQFPLFIKPYDGSMSIDTFHITSSDEITSQHLSNSKFMFMEYVDSSCYEEFTIDMYYDRHSVLKCLVPRKRIEVRGGEINKGITVKKFVFDFLKEKLAFIEGAMGCLTMQVFYNAETDSIKALEINPRFGGGYPLSYLAGANYPRYIIQEYLLNQSLPYFEDWEENLLMLRYDDEVLVHGADI
jgi:carbamoyl-phosphate synthase large subunit